MAKKKVNIKKFKEETMKPVTSGWGSIKTLRVQPDKETLEMLKGMGAKISHERLPAMYINTVQGKAKFVKTEYENEFGGWNDRYYTRYGYYVIHEGNRHHVYKVMK